MIPSLYTMSVSVCTLLEYTFIFVYITPRDRCLALANICQKVFASHLFLPMFSKYFLSAPISHILVLALFSLSLALSLLVFVFAHIQISTRSFIRWL